MYVSVGRKVQHQGVGTGGGCAPSHVEREAEDNLWVQNVLFLLIMGELST